MKLTTTWAKWMIGFGVVSAFLLACNITDQIAEVLATPTPSATATRVRPPTITPNPAMPTPLPGRTKGDPDARVTLVEYADFQCSHCRDFAADAEHRIDETYVKTGKINFTYKYFPVMDGDKIGESHWAAEAAECANEQGKFWEYHDKLFAVWRGANIGTYTKANLKKYAADLNLDTAAFNPCLDNDKYAALVQDHLTEALQLGLPGTPSFLLDGREIPIHSLDFSEFVRFIEPELR